MEVGHTFTIEPMVCEGSAEVRNRSRSHLSELLSVDSSTAAWCRAHTRTLRCAQQRRALPIHGLVHPVSCASHPICAPHAAAVLARRVDCDHGEVAVRLRFAGDLVLCDACLLADPTCSQAGWWSLSLSLFPTTARTYSTPPLPSCKPTSFLLPQQVDGRRSAQFEHTLLLTADGAVALTAKHADSPRYFHEKEA